MKRIGGSPKAAKSIPMGNKKGKLESAHDTKIGPERQGKKYMDGPKGGHVGEKKAKSSEYPPESPYGGKAVVTRHGFILNKSYYK